MSTLTIVVTGTQISPLSSSDTYNVLHGGYLYDPMAYPLSFFYPTSVFGGEIATSFTQSITGGNFKLAYDDLSENVLILDGHYVFCDSEVVFDFSKFDQTESKIIKLTFYPNNDSEIQTYNSYVSSGQLYYPNLSSIKTNYFPSEDFYTLFNPKFSLHCEDGNIINVIVPLTSIQCGIFDSYKDKTLVESVPSYKNPSNVLLFINDTEEDDIILTNISTSLTFELEELTTGLPFATEIALAGFNTAALQQLLTTTVNIPEPPVNVNPVQPPVVIKDKGLVTIIDGIQISRIDGEEIYPISAELGISTFLTEQIFSFSNEVIYSFAQYSGPTPTPTPTPTSNGLFTFVGNDPIVRFSSGDSIIKFS